MATGIETPRDMISAPRLAAGLELHRLPGASAVGECWRRLAAALQVVTSGYFADGLLRIEAADSRTAATRLGRPYAQSPWVQSAIKRISRPILAVPLRFSKMDGTPFEDPDFARYWSSPVAGLPGPEWIEAAVGWIKLEGECFLLMDDTWIRPGARIASLSKLILARPDRMQPIVHGEAVLGWEYTDAAKKRHSLLADQVAQIRAWNPYDSIRGMAEMDAARIAAEADYSAAMFARNVAAANGDRGICIIARNGLPSDDQRHQIIAQLREKRAAAQRGDFRAVFLTGDIAIEEPTVQAVDADFIAQRLQNRQEVYQAFGVPPSMAIVKTDYAIGAASDRCMLIEDTCKPVGAKLCAGIDQIIRRQTGQRLRAWFDWDDHSVMQQVRHQRIDTAAKLWSMGTPLDVANGHLKLSLPAFPGWDKSWVPVGIQKARSQTGAKIAGKAVFRRRNTPGVIGVGDGSRNQNAKGFRRFAQGLPCLFNRQKGQIPQQ